MTKIFAHRGSKGTHPENTLASFKGAVRVGSDGIELDVHLTKDGHLVVIHDETVDRTTNGTGEIRNLTLAEIKAMDAGSWFNETFAGEKIPTLEEVLLLLKELGFNGQLNIELKTDVIQYEGLVEKCLALQSTKDWPFAIVYSSFNPYTLVELKQANPSQEIGLLFESEEWANKGDAMLKKESYHPDLKLLDWTLEWNKNQLPLRVWTVNEDKDINRCFELQIEAIFTDYPEKALQLKRTMSDKLPKIIIIVGPTAVGKTALSIELAKHFNGEIINGDSLQVYKGLDIGTAKVTEEEKEGVPHHLLDICEWDEPFTASDFKEKAEAAIADITSRGKLPIIVGGTGLYIEGLIYGFHYSGEGSNDSDYRLLKEKELEDKGSEVLWNELNAVDPEAAAKISVNNPRRVIRALEVIHATGKKFSSLEIQKTPHYDAFIIGLNTDRALLYERINLRVELMSEAGLEEEARDLYEKSKGLDIQSISGIGYKEWIPYFEGEQSREAIISTIQQNSRRYAKRQLTWFRNRLPQIRWVNLLENSKDKEELLEELSAFVEEG